MTTEVPIEPHPFLTGDRVRINYPVAAAIHGKLAVIDSFRNELGGTVKQTLARVLLDGHTSCTIVPTDHLEKVTE